MIPQNEEHAVIYQNLAQFGSIWHDLAQLNDNVTSRQQGDSRETATVLHCLLFGISSEFLRNEPQAAEARPEGVRPQRPQFPKPGRRNSEAQSKDFRSPVEEIAKPVEGFPKPGRRNSEAGSKKQERNSNKIPQQSWSCPEPVPNLSACRLGQLFHDIFIQ